MDEYVALDPTGEDVEEARVDQGVVDNRLVTCS